MGVLTFQNVKLKLCQMGLKVHKLSDLMTQKTDTLDKLTLFPENTVNCEKNILLTLNS